MSENGSLMKTREIAKKMHKDRDEILNFCSSHDRIFIYGAGRAGKDFAQYLTEEKIEFYAFIVSDGCRKEKQICNRRVYQLGELSFKDNDGIVLAAGPSMQKDIISALKSICFPINNIYIQSIYCKNSNQQILGHNFFRENNDEVYFHEYMQLDRLGQKFGTDKSSLFHNYLNKYEFFLSKLKDGKINILELGVYEGSSLNMWSQYFPKAMIYGVDINEDCIRYENKQCKIIIRDLADENGLDELGKLHPTIVIDDASHLWSHQIKALYHLLPCIQNGGVYILEDLGTSFPSYRNWDFDDAIISAYDFCSAIAEVVTSGEWLRSEHLQANLLPLKEEIQFLAHQVSMISFINESCIIVKK